jgi:hypothetical protein
MNAPEGICLIMREAAAITLPCTTCQVGFSRGDAWMNENLFSEGEILHTTFQRPNPKLVDQNHELSLRV